MTCCKENNQFDIAMELLIEKGINGIADSISIPMNAAIKLERSRYLKAESYEWTAQRQSYANGYKPNPGEREIGQSEYLEGLT